MEDQLSLFYKMQNDDRAFFQKYVKLVDRTANQNLTKTQQCNNAALGLIGEFGEIVDMFKKHLYQGHPFDKEKFVEELGDFMWYIGYVINTLEIIDTIKIDYRFYGKLFWKFNERWFITTISNILHLIDKLSEYMFFGNNILVSFILNEIIEEVVYLCHLFDVQFEEVLEKNIQKLEKRFPNGFDAEKSINRNSNISKEE